MTSTIFETYEINAENIESFVRKMLEVSQLNNQLLEVICMKNQITIILKKEGIK